ncbi:uncharacterized protein TNCV_2938491 [Trichonephila clavipes]|nr:uncharacterized protein TNCV_2938491 [Trichonephila clavipes]
MYKHKCYKIYLSSLDDNYICKLDALDHDVICNDISSAKNGSWIHVAGKLITGRREIKDRLGVALGNQVGWTLTMGKVPGIPTKGYRYMNIVTMLSQEDIPVSSLWDLEMLGYTGYY